MYSTYTQRVYSKFIRNIRQDNSYMSGNCISHIELSVENIFYIYIIDIFFHISCAYYQVKVKTIFCKYIYIST